MKEEPKSNDSSQIIAQALDEMKKELGTKFSPETVNLAELERRTGLSRAKLRRLKENGFKDTPHGNTGKVSVPSVVNGYTDTLDELLKAGVTNSVVCTERIAELGYTGSRSSVKRYIAAHRALVPAPRQQVSPQGNRGRRYETGPGEASDGLGLRERR